MEILTHPHAQAQIVTLPRATHFLATDFAGRFSDVVGLFLDTTAAGALLTENKEVRRPEELALRPLPQYATIEEAVKVSERHGGRHPENQRPDSVLKTVRPGHRRFSRDRSPEKRPSRQSCSSCAWKRALRRATCLMMMPTCSKPRLQRTRRTISALWDSSYRFTLSGSSRFCPLVVNVMRSHSAILLACAGRAGRICRGPVLRWCLQSGVPYL